MTIDELKRRIRDVPDFPKPGILFRDITPLLADPEAFKAAVRYMASGLPSTDVDLLVGIEARGFVFAGALAMELGIGFAPVRKPGKLPWKSVTESYDLEYGQDSLQMHEDAIGQGRKVLVVDDLLATGGTAAAVARLVERIGGEVVGHSFLIELSALGGRKKLSHPVAAVLRY